MIIQRLTLLFKKNAYFLLPYFIFLLLGAFLISLTPKDSLHLYFNRFHSNVTNAIFLFITFFGDGWTAIIITITLMLVRFRYSIICACSYALSSLIVQSLKHFIFNDYDRPALFFKNNSNLYLIPGVDNNIFNSFPSGHSATAFTIYFCLALFLPNKWGKLCMFLLALIVAYSRIYLSQHFFEDIYAGSIIGVCSVLFIYNYLQPTEKKNKLDGSLLNRF